MCNKSAFLEMMRWGQVNIPGILFEYSKELELDIEDLGIIGAVLYAYARSKPLAQTGITAGKVLQTCSCLTRQKLVKRLNILSKNGILEISESGKSFAERTIFIDPLLEKIEVILRRDHPELSETKDKSNDIQEMENKLNHYQNKIEQLELELEQERVFVFTENSSRNSRSFKRVADFIAKKTGNLISVSMSNELRRWLEDMAMTPELILCMLELCFERNITSPRDITRIAAGLEKYAISTVEGLEMYFRKYVDSEKTQAARNQQFDPDIIGFGEFTGIDMNADARKNVYYKWKYDWGFSHNMIMKAGEIMCRRTKNGGLEYIDTVLHDWMSKEIRQVEDVEREIQEFKEKRRAKKTMQSAKGQTAGSEPAKYELYVPPDLEAIESKA